jgi:hypothetical protein
LRESGRGSEHGPPVYRKRGWQEFSREFALARRPERGSRGWAGVVDSGAMRVFSDLPAEVVLPDSKRFSPHCCKKA